MSIIEPKIDVLLNETDNDRFLLCALASKRAHDINDLSLIHISEPTRP